MDNEGGTQKQSKNLIYNIFLLDLNMNSMEKQEEQRPCGSYRRRRMKREGKQKKSEMYSCCNFRPKCNNCVQYSTLNLLSFLLSFGMSCDDLLVYDDKLVLFVTLEKLHDQNSEKSYEIDLYVHVLNH